MATTQISNPGLQPAPLPMHFLQRVGCLAALFVLELLAISGWLDTGSISSQSGLTGFVANRGPLILQGVIAFATLLLTIGYLQARSTIQRLSDSLAGASIQWPMLAGHLAAMSGFAILSHSLFGGTRPLPSDWVAAAWLASGTAGIILAAFTFLPVRSWIELFQSTGSLWIVAAVAGIATAFLSSLWRVLWRPASSLTFTIVVKLLRPFLPIVSDPAALTIGTERFQVAIAPACSGLEGVGLMLLFTGAWLWFFRRECRFPNALVVVPIGVVLIWLLNAVRIAILIVIGNAGAPGIAMGGFHSQAGWIAFNGVALLFTLAFRRVPWLIAEQTVALPAAALDSTMENPVAPYLLPFLGILLAAMISRAASSGFEWLYPLRFFLAAAILWGFRGRYSVLDWRCSWFSPVLGAVVFLMWLGVDWAAGIHTSNDIAVGLASLSAPGRVAWLTFRVLAAVITVPVAEELAFRGFLIRRLVSADFEALDPRTFTWLALSVSSVAFGLMHGSRWLAGTLAGMIYAGALVRRGRIGDAVIAHATSNALLAAWVLVGGHWSLW